MRSSTLGLLLLVSVHAVFNMGGGAHRHPQAGPEPLQTPRLSSPTSAPQPLPRTVRQTRHGVAAASDNTARPQTPAPPPGPGPASSGLESPGESPDSIPTVDPRVFDKRRYRSPRVLFSALPPPPDGWARGGGARLRRRAGPGAPRHRGVYSVCDSVSSWVGNKTTAVDITGNEVRVLPDVRVNNIVKKQYFFETTCHTAPRPSRPGGASCLGIDSRHWNSYCTNTHTFVLAMTSFKSLVAWRLVRINAACVCVLSRKSWRH